ncbi:MAG: very short patch repair endonuclease [Pseudomonas putida]
MVAPMTDIVSEEERSRIMSRVRGKDTKPELVVRRIIYHAGFRYRLHVKNLPGRPDIVFRKRMKIILVHGCFWHKHDNCRLARIPKSKIQFWTEKLEKNKLRDAKVERQLKEDGWDVLTIWECEIRYIPTLKERLIAFLSSASPDK